MNLKKSQRTYLIGLERNRLNGGAIASFLSLTSDNGKVGPSAQVWFLNPDVDPMTDYHSGAPSACPKGCPRIDDLTCYVEKARAPLAIFQAFQRGNTPELRPELYAEAFRIARAKGSRILRFGADGDPATVDPRMLYALRDAAMAEGFEGWTGYTHAWASRRADALRGLVMASVDDVREARAARRRGWRTFRVSADPCDDATEAGEVRCPASAERGNVATCGTCKLCDGASGTVRPSVLIRGHGAGFAGAEWQV